MSRRDEERPALSSRRKKNFLSICQEETGDSFFSSHFNVQSPNLSHPFHLHGYSFNVIGIGRSPDKNVKKINLKHALDLDRRGLLHRQFNLPPLKDTIAVPNNGYVIFRFRADNPGYWLFHCHFLFHIVIGMNLIIHVGTQSDLPPIPPGFPSCGNHLPPISHH
ncbi:hypothetical protein JTB14_026344 [Gonioctena quinquepunctata]|nr:hypothetical protein JTB14_026344 [Gonioctena quinquepunctata]